MSVSADAGARILVVLPNHLGDLVQCEPAVRALVARYGAERVSLAGGSHLLGVLEGRFPGARRIAQVSGDGARARSWRGHRSAVLFQGSFRSAWIAYRAGIPHRLGWARDGRGWLLSDGVEPALERGAIPLGLGRSGGGRRILPRPFGATCAELVGRMGVSVADTRPKLTVQAESLRLARARLAELGLGAGRAGDRCAGWILAAVGSRSGSAKAYPPHHWGRALTALAMDSGREVLLVGGPGEEEVLASVEAATRQAGGEPRRLSGGPTDLAELKALASLTDLVIAADGGPRHVAAAVGARVMWMAGPSDPRHSADHLERGAPLYGRIACGPCHLEHCPIQGAGRHGCMEQLDPLELAARALALLK